MKDFLEAVDSNIVFQLFVTIAIAILAHILLRIIVGVAVERAVRQHHYVNKLDEHKREQTLKGVLRTLLAVVLWIITILVLLQQLGLNLATLATGAGLFGVIFGFGAQSAIKDFVSGLFIIGENQYRVGDIIKLQLGGNTISGTVEALTIRITRLRDLDGNMHIVSNGKPQAVTNLSYEYANVNINIGVAYDADVDIVEEIINRIGDEMTRDEKWAQDIFEPISFLRLDEFEDSAMRIKALGKVRPAAQWAIAGEFRRRIKKAFDEAGIDIPFPQMVIREPVAVAKKAKKAQSTTNR